MDTLLIAVVLFALLFDFTNGFHDTANAIATSVATKAVPPKVAVIGAAILNFLGAFISLEVVATVAKGIVNPGAITLHVADFMARERAKRTRNQFALEYGGASDAWAVR